MTVILIVIDALGRITKRLVKELKELEIKTIKTTTHIRSALITEKSLADLRRLVVAQNSVKNHQVMLV